MRAGERQFSTGRKNIFKSFIFNLLPFFRHFARSETASFPCVFCKENFLSPSVFCEENFLFYALVICFQQHAPSAVFPFALIRVHPRLPLGFDF